MLFDMGGHYGPDCAFGVCAVLIFL